MPALHAPRSISRARGAAARPVFVALLIAGTGDVLGSWTKPWTPQVDDKDQRSLALTELPGPGFPGATVAETNAAWPGRRQPKSLELWPRTEAGELANCPVVTSLQDVATGWPGKCLGLTQSPGVDENECGAFCVEDPLCPSWQFAEGSCWHGKGYDCEDRDGDRSFAPQAASRLQHGDVRVLMDLRTWQILGLVNQFVSNNSTEGVRECRAWCYSYIRCQYWQYGEDGCWVEDPDGGSPVQYPLTLDYAYRNTDFASMVIEGEYIQHYCRPHEDQAQFDQLLGALPSYFPAREQWPWLFGAAALFLMLGAGCVHWYHSSAAKTTRGVKMPVVTGSQAEWRSQSTSDTAQEALSVHTARSRAVSFAELSGVKPGRQYEALGQAEPDLRHVGGSRNPLLQASTGMLQPLPTSSSILPLYTPYPGGEGLSSGFGMFDGGDAASMSSMSSMSRASYGKGGMGAMGMMGGKGNMMGGRAEMMGMMGGHGKGGGYGLQGGMGMMGGY